MEFFKRPERAWSLPLSLFTFTWDFVFPSARALGQFTDITVTAPTGCVTVGETIAVTAVFGPTNLPNQTDNYSIGFGNASTIAWPGGCTAGDNTGSLPTGKPRHGGRNLSWSPSPFPGTGPRSMWWG
jgi:hypothetical protein